MTSRPAPNVHDSDSDSDSDVALDGDGVSEGVVRLARKWPFSQQAVRSTLHQAASGRVQRVPEARRACWKTLSWRVLVEPSITFEPRQPMIKT